MNRIIFHIKLTVFLSVLFSSTALSNDPDLLSNHHPGLVDIKFGEEIVDFYDMSEVRWVKKNKEFWYKGYLYDVEYFEMKDGKLVFHCVKDINETKIYKHRNREFGGFYRICNQQHYYGHFLTQKVDIFSEVSEQSIFALSFFHDRLIVKQDSPPPEFTCQVRRLGTSQNSM